MIQIILLLWSAILCAPLAMTVSLLYLAGGGPVGGA
jgi:hypothetical protein